MTLQQITRLVGSGGIRKKHDFYETPSYVTEELLKREEFNGPIWEPACGNGAISKVLVKNGFDVFNSDIEQREYPLDIKASFMSIKSLVTPTIITNPPFKHSTEFALYALKCSTEKIALFNKLSFLEGKTRRDKLFSQSKLKNVCVF